MAKKKKVVKKFDEKKSAERKEGWFRIIVLIVSGIILSAWSILVKVLVVVNFFITIVSGNRNKEIAEFSEFWNTEMYKFVKYMTFVHNIRPFPFSKMEKISKFE